MKILKILKFKTSKKDRKAATFSNLERRGLSIYGLKVDLDFVEGTMKALVYSKQGKIKLRLIRDTEKYSTMTTKG